MAATTHTPGPWRVAEHDHGIVVCTESDKKSKHGASRYAAIGGFDRKDPEQLTEALANARLIAAAPDLLSALKSCLSAIDQNAYLAPRGSSLDEAFIKARAAIAKATGSES